MSEKNQIMSIAKPDEMLPDEMLLEIFKAIDGALSCQRIFLQS